MIARTERVAVNIADGYTRTTGGRSLGVCAVQYGPGAEAAVAAVAQAYGDGTPILILPSEYDRAEQHVAPNFRADRVFERIAVWAATVNDWRAGPEIFRRAFALLRGGRGPVVVAVADDLLNGAAPGELAYEPVAARRSAADPRDVEETARRLLESERPVIVAGSGVLSAHASAKLRELSELTRTPVMTTLNGKGAFLEDHPLALGTGGRSRPATVDRFLGEADLVLGVGTSFTRSLYVTPLPAGCAVGQIVDDRREMAKCHGVSFGCLGDAGLVLGQILALLKSRPDGGVARARDPEEEIARVRREFLAQWAPRLTSEDTPISPYRLVRELMEAVDRTRTVVTHDAGNPRDQLVPFYETLVPHGYLGWGKTTQLGTGLGLAMGARLARPEWLAVNVMGDAAFGMVGLDFETAVRADLPILTIVLNNGLMGGYGEYMPNAVATFGANRVTGEYAAIARALGGYGGRVEDPAELRPALERCIASVDGGRAALLEVVTREEPVFPLGPDA